MSKWCSEHCCLRNHFSKLMPAPCLTLPLKCSHLFINLCQALLLALRIMQWTADKTPLSLLNETLVEESAPESVSNEVIVVWVELITGTHRCLRIEACSSFALTVAELRRKWMVCSIYRPYDQGSQPPAHWCAARRSVFMRLYFCVPGLGPQWAERKYCPRCSDVRGGQTSTNPK